MAWCRPGAKPLSEPMLVSLLMYIYVSLSLSELIHQDLDKMTTIFQMTFPNAFSWMKIIPNLLKFVWNLPQGVQF